MVLNPREFLVKSIRASLRLAVEDDVREIPEGAAYRIVLDPTAAEPEPQGPRGAGTKDHKWPIKKPKFVWIPTSHSPLSQPFGASTRPSKAPAALDSFRHPP